MTDTPNPFDIFDLPVPTGESNNPFDVFDQPGKSPDPFASFDQPEDLLDEDFLFGVPAALDAFGRAFVEGIPVVGPTLRAGAEGAAAFVRGRTPEEIAAETERSFERSPTATAVGQATGFGAATAPLGVGRLGIALATAPRAAAVGGGLTAADIAARGGSAREIALGGAVGALGGAAGVAIARVGSGVVALVRQPRGATSEVIAEAADQIRKQAKAFYAQSDAVGARVPESTYNGILDKVIKAARPKGGARQQALFEATRPRVASVVRALEDMKAQGGDASLAEIDQVRQFVSDIAKSTDAAEREVGLVMRDAIDDALNNLTNANFINKEIRGGITALGEARKLWSRGRLLETLSEIATRAEISGANTAASMQRRLKTFLTTKQGKRLSKADRRIVKQLSELGGPRSFSGLLDRLRGQNLGVASGVVAGGLTADIATGGVAGLAASALPPIRTQISNTVAQARIKLATDAIKAGRASLPAIEVPTTPLAASGIVAGRELQKARSN